MAPCLSISEICVRGQGHSFKIVFRVRELKLVNIYVVVIPSHKSNFTVQVFVTELLELFIIVVFFVGHILIAQTRI